MPRLILVPTNGEASIDLDEVSVKGSGLEATAGAGGFGLPPVAAQYDEKAGHGSTYRGTRVLARDIDLPIYATEANRASLKSTMSRLARALADPCQLVFHDGSEKWSLLVTRVGGGAYSYGEDTNGEYELVTVITLRAGDPFWKRDTPVTLTRTASTVSGTPLTIVADTEAEAFPDIRLNGPGRNWRLRRTDTGQTLQFNALLRNGEYVDLDFADGTVVDNLGRNRYTDLGNAPRFFPIKPGGGQYDLQFQNSGVDFMSAWNQERQNHFENPRFAGSITAPYKWNLSSSTTTSVGQTPRGSGTDEGKPCLTTYSAQPYTSTMTTRCVGLTPGETYTLAFGYLYGNAFQTPLAPSTLTYAITATTGSTIVSAPAPATRNAHPDFSWEYADKLDVRFVAPPDGTIDVRITVAATGSQTYAYLWEPYIGRGGSYFDATFPAANGKTYAWDGTPNQSRSREFIAETPRAAETSLRLNYTPRKWMVV
jgi:hypothetical protein